MTIRMISAASAVVEAPDLWEKRLPARFASECPRLVDAGDGRLAWAVGGATAAPLELPPAIAAGRDDVARLATPAGRRWAQDRDGTAGEILYSLGGVWNLIHATENDDFIVAATRAYNDWLAELCAADPDRFIGVAKLPTTGVADATAELRRAAEELGLKGAVLDAWPGGPDCPPAMEECEPFWEAAAAFGVPLSLHRPLGGGEEPPYAIAGGAVPEYFSDMTTIIYANIPDRHPAIRFVSLAPYAGWAPPTLEALNESYMRTASLRRVHLGDPDLYPSDYLRRFFSYVTQDDRTALLNRAYFGEAHLLWGSFAFAGVHSEWPNTRQLFERLTAGMDENFREKLAGGNAARLYGVGGARPFETAEVERYASYALL